MNRESIWEVCLNALESTFLSNNTAIAKLDSQTALKNSECDAAIAELETTQHCFPFLEDAAGLLQEQVQSQWSHLCGVEAAIIDA